MLTIYLTRHGQTEWNVQKRMQGWGNGELTESGIADAKKLAIRLQDTHIDKMYASTSKRAYKTAEIVRNGRDIPLAKDDIFREMCFGDWDGQCVDDVRAACAEELECFWERPHLFKREGNESFMDLRERTKKALQMLVEQNKDGDTILLVTHSLFLRTATAIIKQLPTSDIFTQDPPGNTSLTKVIFDGEKFTIEYEGDMSHALD